MLNTMQRQPLFQVIKATLLPSGRFLDVSYKETGSDTVLSTRVGAIPFEHYMKSMHDVDCPTLVEWIVRATKQELNNRIAAYMECMKWEREESESGASYDQHEYLPAA